MVLILQDEVYTNGCGCCSGKLETEEKVIEECKYDLLQIKKALAIYGLTTEDIK
jgi:hypothetical protein